MTEEDIVYITDSGYMIEPADSLDPEGAAYYDEVEAKESLDSIRATIDANVQTE